MRTKLFLAAALALPPMLPSTGLAQTVAATQAASPADQQAIHGIHARWAELIKAKDAASIQQLYANDAVLLAPGEDEVVGSEAIGARWARQLQLEGFNFKLIPAQLVISAAGDLAYDRGTYDFAATIPQVGPIKDTGKYVLVWQKVGGKWKVISDVFNSDPTPKAK